MTYEEFKKNEICIVATTAKEREIRRRWLQHYKYPHLDQGVNNTYESYNSYFSSGVEVPEGWSIVTVKQLEQPEVFVIRHGNIIRTIDPDVEATYASIEEAKYVRDNTSNVRNKLLQYKFRYDKDYKFRYNERNWRVMHTAYGYRASCTENVYNPDAVYFSTKVHALAAMKFLGGTK